MWYILLRIAIIAALTAICGIIFRKKLNSLVRYKKVLLIVVVMCIFFVSLLIPFESQIVKFGAPEQAFHYGFTNENIYKVLQDEDSAFIIYGNSITELNYTFINMNQDNSWEYTTPYKSTNKKTILFNRMFISQVTNNRQNKKLVIVNRDKILESDKAHIEVNDSLHSMFSNFTLQYSSQDMYIDIYYTIIDANTTGYSLIIDGEMVPLIP